MIKFAQKQYTEYDKQRLYVTPGCTGLWQATERNNVGFNEMVKLDLEYIKRSSLCPKRNWAGRTRTYEMPESKSGALPTWLQPNTIKKWGG